MTPLEEARRQLDAMVAQKAHQMRRAAANKRAAFNELMAVRKAGEESVAWCEEQVRIAMDEVRKHGG